MARSRIRLHMTQEQLAEGICSRESITKYENGTAAPSERIARKLAKRLHIDPWSFAQAAAHDRAQLQTMRDASRDHDYTTWHQVCTEMLERSNSKLAQAYFEHCLQVCEEMRERARMN